MSRPHRVASSPLAAAVAVAHLAALATVTQGCGSGRGGPSARALAATTAASATSGTATGGPTTVAQTFATTGGITRPVSGGGTSTPSPPSTPANPVGSRFWYEGDTFGNPLKILDGNQASQCAQVLALFNQERAAAGLPALAFDLDAERAAKAHAEDMLGRSYFSHVSPEGWTPDDRLRMTGAQPVSESAENIAAYQLTPADVVAAWMASPPHRANILSPTLTHAAVGVAGAAGPLWVAVFTRR